ncbi:glucose dehydrogenase [FAD, quinone]-like [Leptidea sinapis]|uniref:glucose dehydrogenase [FAD, quinone]-like n=1 Tax=Leptidea sinapis TaxID=189913 RepID=UPI0021C4B3A3|nr:glucose dehydrogenase [FAD, quinone]-like [Leptidea sinapis]
MSLSSILQRMATQGVLSIKPIVTSTRIIFGLLPGLGALIVLRMAIHLYRPDIEDAENRVRDHPFDKLYDCYDFIIVGGGSAGSVLANRLSENPEWNILLLEAGQDENVLSDVPVLFPTLQTSAIDWQFVTEPSEKYCLSMIESRCKWPRGKVLGGSSALNAMLYIRGNRRDYDNWANLGNPGWSYDEVLQYFLKAEDMRIPEYQNDPYHSVGGPLTVENFRYEQPITRKILEAAEELGYELVDVNGKYQTGFTRSHATVRDGLRCSTAKAYLRPAAKRPNLHVSVHSLVEKILIDENKKAYGVKFTKHKETRIIKASKEVILSAGSIQSPQLLMLSGIGDSNDLKELGIYPIKILSGVGKNLQDHIAMGGHSFLFDNPYTNGSEYCFNLNSVFNIGTLMDFTLHKKGELYSMMEAEAMAFINTKYQDPSEDYPDIQLFIAPTADNMDGGIFGKRANGLTDEVYSELYEDILYQSSFSIVPLLLRPKSRGFIKLKDASPYSPPLIYPNYFSEPQDILTLMEGARLVQDLISQPALQELNTRPNPRRNPGCSEHALMSDEHLECQARHHSLTIYHPVGTCAMGPTDNLEAVVDSKLRVYGITNLRVVDGSIMPTIVSGNTNAPIIMIAEKAADMIKQDWDGVTEDNPCTSDFYLRQAQDPIPTDEDKSTINNPPDIFAEMKSLFSNLPEDQPLNQNINLTRMRDHLKPAFDGAQTTRVKENPYNVAKSRKTKHSKHKSTYSPVYTSRPVSGYWTDPATNVANVPYYHVNYFPPQILGYPYYNAIPPVQFDSDYSQLHHDSILPSYVYNQNKERKTLNDQSSGDNKCKVWLHKNGRNYEVEL